MTDARRALVLATALLGFSQAGYTFYETANGTPLRWYRHEVPVREDKALCEDVPAADTLAAVTASLKAWNDVPCGNPPLVDGGLVSGVPPVKKVGGGEVGGNLIIFEEGEAWLADKTDVNVANVIALTTLFYDPNTGEARSYALEMNQGDYTFGVLAAPNPKVVDLQNTLTHELGHVLALDHSEERESTMYYSAPTGEMKKRTLADDDRNGLCQLYSEAYAEVNPDATDGGGGKGCRSAPIGSPVAAIVALLGLATLALSRRRPVEGRAARRDAEPPSP